jgi:hypothetical protein
MTSPSSSLLPFLEDLFRDCRKTLNQDFFGDVSSWFYCIMRTHAVARIHKVDGETVSIVKPYEYLCSDHADEVHVPPGSHEWKIWLLRQTWIMYHPGTGFIPQITDGLFLTHNLDTQPGHICKITVPIYWKEDSIIKTIDEATGESSGRVSLHSLSHF